MNPEASVYVFIYMVGVSRPKFVDNNTLLFLIVNVVGSQMNCSFYLSLEMDYVSILKLLPVDPLLHLDLLFMVLMLLRKLRVIEE